MALEAILTDQTTSTTSAGVVMTGPCSVEISGVFDGAKIVLQAATSDTESKYKPIGFKASITSEGWVDVNLQGTYHLRAKLLEAGDETSLTVEANQ